ncbi:chemotaxis protein CheW [Natronorubrum halophilum]|uniref:chemotaxis protein CheW n=1 Tax=Natronorubrum halophilum TaxID=1702106 RepID=UPI0010C1A0C5|nr:chemotaxis protein CheW [Natronorubrum halophilum]
MASGVDRDDDDAADRATVLTFTLGGKRYCVGAASVASVVGVTADRSVATADDPWNAGSVSVAGERVRVVDLPRAFTAAGRTTTRIDEPKLLIFTATDADGSYYGWLVDDVDAARTIRPDRLEPTRTGTHLPHVRGYLEIGDDDVIWLDERAIHG